MTSPVLSEQLLRSRLNRHLGFLARCGYSEPLLDWDGERWRVTYASDSGVSIELEIDAERVDIATHIVGPKRRLLWSLDSIANVPEFRDEPWTQDAVDRRLAAEGAALESVEDLLSGDVGWYRERAL